MNLPYTLIKTEQLQEKNQEIVQLKQELEKAAAFIKNIEQGNLNLQLEGEVDKRYGLVSALLSMLEQMKKIAEQEKERTWAREGLAMFVDILRKNNEDIATLSMHSITHLVKYLHACQGGLFIVNDEPKEDLHLQLLACYAYERRKYLQKRINIGEGILGQAYLERDTVYLTDLPQDYMHITSGLGGATPSSLLIVPLKVNEQVFGLIEIASFYNFEKYQIEFLEKLSETIASTLSTVKINESTKKLLAEAQQQTEEMRAQEEEMRQNMEELHATQEHQIRLEEELRQNEQTMQVQLKELQEALEITKVKQIEEERTRERLEAQKKTTEKIIGKYKENEQALKHEVERLTQELNKIKP